MLHRISNITTRAFRNTDAAAARHSSTRRARNRVSIGVLCLLLCFSTGQAVASDYPGSAFGTMGELAAQAESERRVSSAVLFVGSGLLGLAGVGLHMGGEYEASSFAALGSAAALGVGTVLHTLPSDTERAWARINEVNGVAAQETRAQDALVLLASQNRTRRLMGGTLHVGLAGYYLFLDSSDSDKALYSGVAALATGIASLMIQSPAERALARLERTGGASSARVGSDWSLGLASGHMPGLSLNMNF